MSSLHASEPCPRAIKAHGAEHVARIRHSTHVPAPKISIEIDSTKEHQFHADDGRSIPVADVRVENCAVAQPVWKSTTESRIPEVFKLGHVATTTNLGISSSTRVEGTPSKQECAQKLL